MSLRWIILLIASLVLLVALWNTPQNIFPNNLDRTNSDDAVGSKSQINTDPLSIERMRSASYPGSQLVIEQELGRSGAHTEYIVSYRSEGLKIYALLTVPVGEQPAQGWPVIIFNHGYIPPTEYRTNERYVAYVNGFANQGYVVLKPGYRGHGSSEGKPEGAYFSPAYTVDVLNAIGAMKQYAEADPNRIGMWGHSLGGNITQRALVLSPDIKAAVIWGGVVGSYRDMYSLWFNRRRTTNEASLQQQQQWRMTRSRFSQLHGTPESNPEFWNTIDPTSYLRYQTAPVQLHHTRGDETVTYQLSEAYATKLTEENKPHELYLYEGDDHNVSQNFSTALQRSVAFFDRYLK